MEQPSTSAAIRADTQARSEIPTRADRLRAALRELGPVRAAVLGLTAAALIGFFVHLLLRADIDLRRALDGELARTIASPAEVEAMLQAVIARLHPQPRLELRLPPDVVEPGAGCSRVWRPRRLRGRSRGHGRSRGSAPAKPASRGGMAALNVISRALRPEPELW